MAVRFVQNAVNSANPTTTITKAFTANVVSGNLLICYCWQGNDSTDDTSGWTVTDTIGNIYTRFAHASETSFVAGGATGSKHALFATISKAGGANTISVGFGGSKLYGRMAIWEYSGAMGPVDRAILSSSADSAPHFASPSPYFYQTSTAATDPGSTNLKLNNATLTSATQLYINSVSVGSCNRDALFSSFLPGIGIRLFDNVTPVNHVDYTVTSLTNNTGWWTIGLSNASLTGTMPQAGGSAWWAIFNWADDTVAPSIYAVAGGRVGAAMQQLEGSTGTGGYIGGTGMQNYLQTASDGYLGTADISPSVSGIITPTFSNKNFSGNGGTHTCPGEQLGMSWSIAPMYPMTADDPPVGSIGRGAGW